MSTAECSTCRSAFVPRRGGHRYCSRRCASKATMHDRSLPAWRWWEDDKTVAWRANVVALIDAQRAAPSEPAFHCGACGSDVSLPDLVARRRIV